jgi:hypothetical protein
MDPILPSLALNILSSAFYDIAKARLGSIPAPLVQSIELTASAYPAFPGLSETMQRWLVDGRTEAVLNRFLKGEFGPSGVPIGELTTAFIDENAGDFFLEGVSIDQVRQIILSFLSNLREKYLAEPGLGTQLIANRQEAIAAEQNKQLMEIRESFESFRHEITYVHPLAEDKPRQAVSEFDSQLEEIKHLIETHDYSTPNIK